MSINHLIDLVLLRESWGRIRKDGAAGVDGETAQAYGQDLEKRLGELHGRLRAGTYRAPPVRRVWIPKADGKKRPIGIPTLEDKIAQRAAATVIEAVMEPLFLDSSYGFRPGRSAHQALWSIQRTLMHRPIRWVLEIDLESFFDTLDHGWLRRMVDVRIGDGVIQRLIGKWLNAGVLEEGKLTRAERGSPQGGVISPLLANIYLHYAVDLWFARVVRPELKGEAYQWRYADDILLAFEHETEAREVQRQLGERLAKFGLRLNPSKTRLLRFERPAEKDEGGPPDRGMFDFLGFTHYWARSRRGSWVVKRRTAGKRLRRAMSAVTAWCKAHRHWRLREQHRHLNAILRGHYQYYGMTWNWNALSRFHLHVVRTWQRWLSRRSQTAYIRWERMEKILAAYPLLHPHIVHPDPWRLGRKAFA
jgi:group II intron reverse transcriptase/maturase